MEGFWKAAAVIILTIILSVSLEKTEKDFCVIMSVTACCVVMVAATQYLSDVIAFLWELGENCGYQNVLLNILLKIIGVALTTELTGMISADAGNSSLGKAMHILGTAAILFLSLPLFESFFTTIQEILSAL